MLIVIGQVDGLADETNLQRARHPALAQPGVQHRRFYTRIATHNQDNISVFKALYSGVQKPALALAMPQHHAILTAVEAGDAEAAKQIPGRLHGFGVLQVAGDHAHPVRARSLQLCRDGVERRDAGHGRDPRATVSISASVGSATRRATASTRSATATAASGRAISRAAADMTA